MGSPFLFIIGCFKFWFELAYVFKYNLGILVYSHGSSGLLLSSIVFSSILTLVIDTIMDMDYGSPNFGLGNVYGYIKTLMGPFVHEPYY